MNSSTDKGLKWWCKHALEEMRLYQLDTHHLCVCKREEIFLKNDGRCVFFDFILGRLTNETLCMLLITWTLYSQVTQNPHLSKRKSAASLRFFSGAKSANVSSHLQRLRHWNCSCSVSVDTSVLASPELWLPVCSRCWAARRYVQFNGSRTVHSPTVCSNQWTRGNASVHVVVEFSNVARVMRRLTCCFL